MQIIKVPSIYSVRLPGGEWINLALVRRMQVEMEPPLVVLTWSRGDSQVYNGEAALAIVQAWEETAIDKKSNISQTNTRIDDEGEQEMEKELLEILRRRGGGASMKALMEICDPSFSTLRSLVQKGSITITGQEVSLTQTELLVSGEEQVIQQLRAFGATNELIVAVLEGSGHQIKLALAKIDDPDDRDRLTKVVQRLGLVQGAGR